MAAAQHNPSRRALLGAAVALPLASASSSFSFETGLRRAQPLLRMSGRGAGAQPLLGMSGEGEASLEEAPPPRSTRSPSPAKAGEELAWASAVEAYEAAEAEVEDAVGWPGEYEAEYGERLDALCDSLRRLWRTPAPDLGALALKIDLAIEHELGTLAGGATCLAAIQSDAQRLAAAYPGL